MTTADEARKAQQRTRKAAERARKRGAGQKPFEVWAHPDDWTAISAFANKLAARKADERARNKESGLSEVRGIHAPQDDHPTIREAAKKLAGELAKKRKPATPTKG